MENSNETMQNQHMNNASAESVAVMRKPTALLRDTWHIYTANIFTFIGILLIPALVSLLLPVIIGGLWFAEALSFGVSMVLVIVIGIVMAVIGLWGQLALLFAITDDQYVLSITDAYRRAWPHLLSFFWIVVLVSAITVGGFMLFVIPGIIISVWFSFAWYVFVTEQVKGMDALMRSKEYVRGYWWSVVWRSIVLSVVLFVVYAIVQFATSAFGSELVDSLTDTVLSFVLTPFVLVFMFLVYKDLKQIKGVSVVSTGNKTPFVLLGFFGVLIVPLLAAGLMFLAWFALSEMEYDYPRTLEEADIIQEIGV